MNEQERELDMALAEAEQENRKLRAEIQLLTEALRAQRTWAGLTDEEVSSLWEMSKIFNQPKHFYLLIEAKLKEKNHGA